MKTLTTLEAQTINGAGIFWDDPVELGQLTQSVLILSTTAGALAGNANSWLLAAPDLSGFCPSIANNEQVKNSLAAISGFTNGPIAGVIGGLVGFNLASAGLKQAGVYGQ